MCQQAVRRTLLYLLADTLAVYSFIERASALEGLRQRRMYTFNYLDSKTIHLSGDFDFYFFGGGTPFYCPASVQLGRHVAW